MKARLGSLFNQQGGDQSRATRRDRRCYRNLALGSRASVVVFALFTIAACERATEDIARQLVHVDKPRGDVVAFPS